MRTKKILLILFLIITFFKTNVFASTQVYPRSEDDLKIHSSIKVTNSVKESVLATPKVNASEKVYDFANLFTSSEESTLYNLINNFINNYNMDMAIVTINENNKSSAMAYADDFYDYNDFGKGTTFDGLLFLIDMDTREMWISTTGQAILMYDDNRIDIILDRAYTYISSQKYFECAKSFITSSFSYASQGIPYSNKDYTINSNGEYTKDIYKLIQHFPLFWAIIIAFIISTISVFIARSKHKTIKKATEANQYLIESSIKFTKIKDHLINSHVSKVYDPPSSSYGGGSSGGGSSTHHSSSGRSHGGGGRRF